MHAFRTIFSNNLYSTLSTNKQIIFVRSVETGRFYFASARVSSELASGSSEDKSLCDLHHANNVYDLNTNSTLI